MQSPYPQGPDSHLIKILIAVAVPILVLSPDGCMNLHKLPTHWPCPTYKVKGMGQIPKGSARIGCSRICGKGWAGDLIRIPYQKLLLSHERVLKSSLGNLITPRGKI